jgi:hypothetical protein
MPAVPSDSGQGGTPPAEGAHGPARYVTSADGSERPPPPPRELLPDPASHRTFEASGEEWTARIAGKSAGGTGGYGLGMLHAIHFARGADQGRPLFEALLPRGRFEQLFDEELRELLRYAVAIPPSDLPDPSR